MKKLSKAEIEIIQVGLSSPDNLDYFCKYWYNKGGGEESYFKFDRNFTSEGAWQNKLVFASQPLIVGVMGIGSGKTLGVGMAGFTWGMSTENFRFMNGANWAYQSKLMKDLVMEQIIDTPAEDMIEKEVDTPYPKISLAWRIGGATIRSTMEFMSMDGQAAKIFSWRGDWINLDEAALVKDLDIALMNLSTRLTGKTSRGREYLGRMSLMSNPWDNDSALHLYYFYDLAIDSPGDCLSISIPTSANKNVTDRQISNALRFVPEKGEQERLLGGLRPEGKGRFFTKSGIASCSDPYISEYIQMKSEQNTPGYRTINESVLGLVEYELPRTSDYCFLVGDPGFGSLPARNAPVCAVIDASRLPDAPAAVVAFWWGNGGGSIGPFIERFYSWQAKYRPIFSGVDSTGPQSGMVQVLNIQRFWDSGNMENMRAFGADKMMPIIGLDFSTGRKMSMLLSLKNMIELGLIVWPSSAKGIRTQLQSYDPLLDRGGEPKIAQDIVACLSMGAFVIRAYYNLAFEVERKDSEAIAADLGEVLRNIRTPQDTRSYRS